MPPKKAAKNMAAKKNAPQDRERKDLCRAYEHLGRVNAMQSLVTAEFTEGVHTLVSLAEQELGQGRRKDAADLLRVAEHLSFAAAARSAIKAGDVSAELKDIVTKEVEHLLHKAQKLWAEADKTGHHPSVTTIFHKSIELAGEALKAGSFREALEVSRGTEALAHVKAHAASELHSGSKTRSLGKA